MKDMNAYPKHWDPSFDTSSNNISGNYFIMGYNTMYSMSSFQSVLLFILSEVKLLVIVVMNDNT